MATLSDPELYLCMHEDKLVILDEVQRVPELFQSLRGLIDRGRRKGLRAGRFLLLGSASIELLRRSGETLAGRIAYAQPSPLDVTQIDTPNRLWLRGGFTDSFLAGSDQASLRWRRDFVRTQLERDIPALGPRITAETLRRFWTMLAHRQSALSNSAELACALGMDAKTVNLYLDLSGRSDAGATAGAVARQYRQTVGEIAAYLCARHRQAASAAWAGYA